MIYRIIKEIKDVLLDEPFVNTVTEGDIFEVDLNKQTMFPLSHIIMNSATHQGNVLSFNITILLMDIINKLKRNIKHLLEKRKNHARLKMLEKVVLIN
jgi:hypothetical protein